MTDVVLGDDHAVFLDALSAVLTELGCTVTKATTVAQTVLEVTMRQPDLCLIDRHFAVANDGIDALAQLVAASPATKVLILSADGEHTAVRRAMGAGAVGYVHKTRGVAVLKETIQRVLRGEVVVEVPASAENRPQPAQGQHDAARLATYLTARERQCLQLLVEGQDTAAIASSLGVSGATVRTHVQALMTKLGVHSRLEAAAFAVQHGLVEMPSLQPELTTRYAAG